MITKPPIKIKVRCFYDGTLAPKFDATVHRAAGRTSQASGMNFLTNRRDLSWSCANEADAAELRQRLATCPEVRVDPPPFPFPLTLSRDMSEQTEQAVERPQIVCLCGSTRFMDAFFEAGWDFTLKGYIVLSVGVCKHADKDGAHGAEALGQDVADRLDELHLRKIDLADLVYFLNIGGYIGESTLKELKYAIDRRKSFQFHEFITEKEFTRLLDRQPVAEPQP